MDSNNESGFGKMDLNKMNAYLPSWEEQYRPRHMVGLLLLASLVLVWSHSLYRKSVSPLRKINGPWYGAFTSLHLRYLFNTGEIWKYVEKQHKKYGTIIRLGPRHVWISDVAAMKQILLTIDLPKVTMYSEISRDKNAPGLFGEIRPDPHRRLKKFLSPAFTTTYVNGLDGLFQQCMQALLTKYQIDAANASQDSDRIQFQTDLMEDLHNIALDIMGECSFGKGFGSTDPYAVPLEGIDEEVWRSIPRSVFDHLARRYKTVYVKRALRWLGYDYKFDWSPEMITAIDTTIQKRFTDIDSVRPDLLQHMLEEGKRPDNGMKFSTREIVDQMSEILLAGSETTSGTIAGLFIHLARNPDVKRRLLASLPVLRSNDPIISGKAVRAEPQFEYLNACIQECLRVHPIASEMGRRTGNKWVNLMGYDLPPHTVVSASYRFLHLDPELWPEPQRFWPERWLPEGKRDGAPAANMSAYYPFSAGKHSCIGINFAWAEMRVVSANILSRYDVEEMAGQNIDLRQYITLQITDGHWKTKMILRTKNEDATRDG